ncbi:hypothetical protein J1N35_022018 [Gossypium stocksii]|uniref:Uncharacterized protein n=1 Tax=Gossypium stocksii TaxID=47602 RepID=A0A9D3VHD5_9ROSI|nr:hypothetical protein J1N35_022018 [Gossypium stocksii]
MLIVEERSIEGDYARVVVVTKNNVESSREVKGEEIKSHVPPAQGQGPVADLSAVENDFRNAFITIMDQWFDQCMGTVQLP